MKIKNKKMKNKKKIVIVISILILLVIGFFAGERIFRGDGTPPILTANFVDLDKVEKISKFRSCQGHTVVSQDESESKRSMKHYVRLNEQHKNTGKVGLYSPFDGYVMGMHSDPEEKLEGSISIGTKNSAWEFTIEHINILSEIKNRQKVKAGELFGYVPGDGFDVIYSVYADEVKVIDSWTSPFAKLDSIFNHMSNKAFAEYQKRGVENRNKFIYTREYRDSNPCRYLDGDDVQSAQLNDLEHPEDWIYLK